MKEQNLEEFSNLIKGLEKISLPEIEIPSHKKELKQALLNKYYKEKRSFETFNILKKVVPAGAVAAILIFLILNNLILPQYALVKAKEIALKNPRVKKLVERGAIIKDVKILKNKGYVLVQPPAETEIEYEEKRIGLKTEEEFLGALAEVNLKEKRVSKIERVTPPSFLLAKEEEERAKEIAKNNPEIQRIVPKGAEIKKIIPLPFSRMRLIKEKNSVKVVPEKIKEKKVRIIYELNKNQWEGKIDLIKGKVSEVKSLGKTEE